MVVPIPSKTTQPSSLGSYSVDRYENYPSNYRGGGIYNPQARAEEEFIANESAQTIEREPTIEELYGVTKKGNYYFDSKGRRYIYKKGELKRSLTSSQKRRAAESNLGMLESMGVLTKSPEGKYLSAQGVQKYNENVRQQNALRDSQQTIKTDTTSTKIFEQNLGTTSLKAKLNMPFDETTRQYARQEEIIIKKQNNPSDFSIQRLDYISKDKKDKVTKYTEFKSGEKYSFETRKANENVMNDIGFNVNPITQQSMNTKQENIFRRGFNKLQTYEQNLISEQDPYKRMEKNFGGFSLNPIKNYNTNKKITEWYIQNLGAERTFKIAWKQTKRQSVLFGLGVVKGASVPFIYPKETMQGLKQSFFHPIETSKQIGKQFMINPAGTLGEFYGGSKLFKVGEGSLSLGRNLGLRLSSKNVPWEKYVNIESGGKILKGETSFPTSSSVEQAFKNFQESTTETGTIKVISASPEPITTYGQSKFLSIGEGTSGNKRTVGLYTSSAKTGGSPYFFGIAKGEGYSFSLFPKIAERPTLSIFEVKGVERIPASVLKKGIAYENLWLQNQGIAAKGKVFITGNLERAYNKGFKGWSTIEEEAIIPVGSLLKTSSKSILGYDESFSFAGRRIPVREYKLITDIETTNPILKLNIKNPFINKGKYVKEGKSTIYYEPSESKSLVGEYFKVPKLDLIKYNKSSYKPSSYKVSSYKISSSKASSSKASSSKLSSITSSSYKPSSYKVSSYKTSSYKPSSYTSSSGSSSTSYSGTSRGGSSGKSSGRYSSTYTPIIPIPIKSFKFAQRNKGTSKKSKQKRTDRFKYKYTPTIEAAIFNIRARKTNMQEAKTGLFLRPILTRN